MDYHVNKTSMRAFIKVRSEYLKQQKKTKAKNKHDAFGKMAFEEWNFLFLKMWYLFVGGTSE